MRSASLRSFTILQGWLRLWLVGGAAAVDDAIHKAGPQLWQARHG